MYIQLYIYTQSYIYKHINDEMLISGFFESLIIDHLQENPLFVYIFFGIDNKKRKKTYPNNHVL